MTTLALSSPLLAHTNPEVLFLDFDGVLQTPKRRQWREMEHCEGLFLLLEQRPQLGVVVTSTHREGKSNADVALMLPDKVAQRVVGATPVLPVGRARGGRQLEIELWLASHPDVSRWVAVDDESFLFSDDCPWLVRTDAMQGWTDHTTYAVRAVLSGLGFTSKSPDPGSHPLNRRC